MKTIAVIVAAGNSQRFRKHSSHTKKQFILIDGKPLWRHSSDRFESLPFIDGILIVGDENDLSVFKEELALRPSKKVIAVISGGAERQDSVYQALCWLKQESPDVVMVHDAARPYVTAGLIGRVWNAHSKKAVVPSIAVADTLKRISSDNQIVETLDRSAIRRIQTPQLFQYSLLLQAYETHIESTQVTDDASLVEKCGVPVTTIEGESGNIKVTVPEDVEHRYSHTSVGQGTDVHAFADGDHIVLGGISIPFYKGLKGHSDADVLTHAICDALLGGAGLSDIGTYFPDTDAQYKGISSLTLLEKVVAMVEAKSCKIDHIDATVMAEEPKLTPYIQEMRSRLSTVVGLPVESVSVKATTMEGLGAVGRKEGIMVTAIATIRKCS